jgi:hypothetical protein
LGLTPQGFEKETIMSIYAIIYLLLNVFSLGYIASKHGQSRIDTWNVWPVLIVWAGITMPLLYMGGFFDGN